MADNELITVGTDQGAGTSTVAMDDIGGVKFQRVKLVHGADGVNAGDVASGNPLPVSAVQSGAWTVSGSGTFTVAGSGNFTVVNAGTFAIQDSEKVVDNAAFTDGTTKVQPAGFIFDEVAGTALTENDAAAARIDSKRAQVAVIEDETTRGRRVTVTAANALKVDGSAVTQPVSITGNQAVNVAQINGVAPLMGAGATGTGSHRVTIATDGQGQLVDNAAFTDGTTRVDMAGFIFDEVAGTALTENDAAAARINANRAVVASIEDGATRTRYATVTAANALKVDGSAVTQPVSGTVTATPGSNGSTTAETLSQAVKTVAAAGTPERLTAASTKVERVFLTACKGFNSPNTSEIFIGSASGNDANFIRLMPWETKEFTAPPGKKIDLTNIFIDVVTNGDGLAYYAQD